MNEQAARAIGIAVAPPFDQLTIDLAIPFAFFRPDFQVAVEQCVSQGLFQGYADP